MIGLIIFFFVGVSTAHLLLPKSKLAVYEKLADLAIEHQITCRQARWLYKQSPPTLDSGEEFNLDIFMHVYSSLELQKGFGKRFGSCDYFHYESNQPATFFDDSPYENLYTGIKEMSKKEMAELRVWLKTIKSDKELAEIREQFEKEKGEKWFKENMAEKEPLKIYGIEI